MGVELFANANVHEALFLFDYVEGIANVTLLDDDLSFGVFLELGGHGNGVDFVGFEDFSQFFFVDFELYPKLGGRK